MDAYYHHLLYRAGITNPNAYTGYDDRERRDLWNLKEKLLPKVIQIQLQNKTKQNQDKTTIGKMTMFLSVQGRPAATEWLQGTQPKTESVQEKESITKSVQE